MEFIHFLFLSIYNVNVGVIVQYVCFWENSLVLISLSESKIHSIYSREKGNVSDLDV